MVRWLVALAVAVAAIPDPTPAEACSCMSPRVRGVPDDKAPVNTHVYLFVPQTRLLKTTFTLQRAAKLGPQPVETTQRGLSSAAPMQVVEMVPKQTLLPNTHYAVVDGEGREILKFETTGSADITPPKWGGSFTAELVRDEVVCCICQSGAPYVDFDTIAGTDDTSAADELLYALWIPDARGRLDYSQPPSTIVRGGATGFTLGAPSICGVGNFNVPVNTSMKLGIRLLDFAGNASLASEIRVPLGTARLRKRGDD